jgi:hypothetical protein
MKRRGRISSFSSAVAPSLVLAACTSAPASTSLPTDPNAATLHTALADLAAPVGLRALLEVKDGLPIPVVVRP